MISFGKFKKISLPKSNVMPKPPNIEVGFVIKDWFFSSDNVRKRLDGPIIESLRKFGAYTRTTARRSMKTVAAHRVGTKGYYSKPFSPPHAHAREGTGGLKYGPFNILYGYNPITQSVVIGPRKKPSRTDYVPMILEYGGNVAMQPNPRRKVRKIGDYGAISYSRDYKTRGRKGVRGVRGLDGKLYFVQFAKLKSRKMLNKCSRIESEIWGGLLMYAGKIAPRPYMRPAFQKALAMWPRFWADANKKTYFTGG
jgi:hypothetical protein